MQLATRFVRIFMVGAFVVAASVVGCSGSDSPLGGDSESDSSGNDKTGSTGTTAGSDGGVALTDSGTARDAGTTSTDDASSPVVDAGTGSFQEAGSLSVKWGPGCWYSDSGNKYQAMSFDLTSDAPVPLEATLFYNDTCDPSDGTDNLNDTGGTLKSGSFTFWFIHHPNQKPTSAIWSFDNLATGCIDYTSLPDCN
jgi:hypothetical protein